MVVGLLVLMTSAPASSASLGRNVATSPMQVAGAAGSQLSVVSAPIGQSTDWEVPADIDDVTAQICAGAGSAGGASPCVSARVKVTEAQVLSILVGRVGHPSSLLDPSRPRGSRSLIAIGPSGKLLVGSTDVTGATQVTPSPGTGSDGSVTLWLPPGQVHPVARAVNGDGTVLNVIYALHPLNNPASNVYHGIGPTVFPLDITGVEYSIDGGTTWKHSGGPPPAAGFAGTFSIRNLTPATRYTVLVRAVNGAGPGIEGSTAATTFHPATSPTTIPATTAAPTTTAPATTTPATTTPATTTAPTTAAPPSSVSTTPATTATPTTATPTTLVPTTTGTPTTQPPTTIAATTVAPQASTTLLPDTTAVPRSDVPSSTVVAPTIPAGSASRCTPAPSGGWYLDTVGTVGSTLTITPCIPPGPLPTNFAITGGSLPTGVVLDNDAGVISGTPTESSSGAGEAQLTAIWRDGSTTVSTFRIGVNQMGHALGYPNRNIGTVGQPMAITPTQASTSGPARFSVVSGTLPAGLTLDGSTGVISGTPTTPVDRPQPIVVRSEDANGPEAASFVVVVNLVASAAPWIRYPDNAFQVTHHQVQVHPMTSDLPAGVSFELSGGRLPAGLSLNQTTGIVSGVTSEPTSTSGLLVTAIGSDRIPLVSAALNLTLIVATGPPVARDVSTATNWWWLVLVAAALLLAALVVVVVSRRKKTGTTVDHV